MWGISRSLATTSGKLAKHMAPGRIPTIEFHPDVGYVNISYSFSMIVYNLNFIKISFKPLKYYSPLLVNLVGLKPLWALAGFFEVWLAGGFVAALFWWCFVVLGFPVCVFVLCGGAFSRLFPFPLFPCLFCSTRFSRGVSIF